MALQMSILSALFVSGLVSGFSHCLGMCGPLVLMVGSRFPKTTLSKVTLNFSIYHAGRVIVYAILGFLVGWIGSLLGLGTGFFYISAWISLIFGAVIILVGMGYIHMTTLEMVSSGSAGPISQVYGRLFKTGSSFSIFPLGVLNGLLPCGLLYSALLLAVSTGSPYWGALGMVVFGLATAPFLLIFSIGVHKFGPRYRKFFSRFANQLIMIVGAQLVLRGLASLGLISHLQIAGELLW